MRESTFSTDRTMGTILVVLAALGCFMTVTGMPLSALFQPRFLWFLYFVAGIRGGMWIRSSEPKGFIVVLAAGGIGALMALSAYGASADPTIFFGLLFLGSSLVFPGYAAARLFDKYGPPVASEWAGSVSLDSRRVQFALTILSCLLVMRVVSISQDAAHQREVAALQETITSRDAEIAKKQSDLDDRAIENTRLRYAYAQQESRIGELSQTVVSLQQQTPEQHMTSEDAFTSFVEDIVADGLHKFGSDVICGLIKWLWNYWFPSLRFD